VFDAFGRSMAEGSPQPGFIAAMHVNGKPSRVRLVTQDEHAPAPRVIHEMDCGVQRGSATAAYTWLMGIGTPLTGLHERIPKVDAKVIGPLIERDRSSWRHLPVQRHDVGVLVGKPKVSIIVPLYGRVDFVEHQFVEFAKDDWLLKHAQLIYVIDDPRLVDDFPALAEALHRLYRIPFTWLWGSANRGFSGANNLGAEHATAPHLLFLNSDAFPMSPGWLQPLLSTLETDSTIGAVGPRLLFGDGSIQHASMRFERRNELGIWINHHPYSGLDPKLDPHTRLSPVTGVTGACLAMRRQVFDTVDGWDTGYLVGDFEDSDLCLKLRANGYTVAYEPGVELTHLERQSFKLLGQDEFRTKVVIYNAVRHQRRWAALLGEPATQPTARR